MCVYICVCVCGGGVGRGGGDKVVWVMGLGEGGRSCAMDEDPSRLFTYLTLTQFDR